MIYKYELKNKEVRWGFHLYLGVNPDTGKDIQVRKKGFISRNEAKNAESRAIYNYKENKIISKQPHKIKFNDLYKLWLEQYIHTVKENTFATTKQIVDKHIVPVFGDYYIDRISIQLCQKTINYWYKNYVKSANFVSIVNRIFDFGISLGICTDNPMRKTIRPKNTKQEHYDAPFFNKNELIIFFDTLKEETLMNQTIFRLFAFTGIRKGELMGLQWQDLDEVNRTLSINRVLTRGIKSYIFQEPKTKSSRRIISLDENTFHLLKKWQLEQKKDLLKFGYNSLKPNQLIFTHTHNNSHIAGKYCNGILNRITEKAGLKDMTVHGFRHTHCSLLFESGVSMKEVQERLGHSSIQTTMNIYTHVTRSQSNKVAEQFANFVNI